MTRGLLIKERMELAKYTKSYDVLEMLVNDNSVLVRQMLLENKNVTQEMMEVLARDLYKEISKPAQRKLLNIEMSKKYTLR